MRESLEIQELLKKDPFFALRDLDLHDDDDEELFELYQIFGMSDWEYNNAVNYMAQKILLED